MPFSDIVGHQQQVETLRQSLEKNRLHHAFLFLGAEGVGKRTVALSLAMAVQCLEKVGDFCNICANCVKIRSGHHPDVRLLGLLPQRKEISIQQVREMERELNFHPFSGRKKIAIVDPAALMNASAQNALLKTLEEPPRDSLLILISTGIGGLLPTLLSRCLRLSFPPLPVELVTRFLVSERGIKQEKAEILAAMTMGSLGAAIRLEAEDLLEKRKIWAEKIDSLERENYREGMVLAEEFAGTREKSLEFLEWLEGWYRDILVYHATENLQGIRNFDMEKEIKNQARLYKLERILFLLAHAVRTRARVQRNVNRRMALENLFVEIVRTE
jgi:DNA polymerase-3 subunit delta'